VSAPLVALRRASVRFGAVTALRGIDLELRRGERLMLVGPNGSGKTTLLRLLQGVVAAVDGERLLPSAPPATAMVFQRPFLLRLSVRRNLYVALWLRGVPRAEWAARTADALHRVGLEGVAERSAPTLSGGQQQRLALARAWALRPDLLLLDEPTASLDPGAKREVEALIAQIADAGVTLVMSTHNLGQARRLGGRIACLEGGRLLVDRATEAFFNDPLPPAAAAFVKGELPWP
jgi:tungstate transport system ATP-binding protein